jgi:hypothetical protein
MRLGDSSSSMSRVGQADGGLHSDGWARSDTADRGGTATTPGFMTLNPAVTAARNSQPMEGL